MPNMAHMAAEAFVFWQAASIVRAHLRSRVRDTRVITEQREEIEVIQQYTDWPLLKARCETVVKEASCGSSA